MHFYLPDGTPFYEVPNKSKPGQMRDATIRDARQVGAYPSVTTITGLLDKPGLNVWKMNQAILAALTNPNIKPGMSEQEILALLRADAMEQARQAAEQGNQVHDALEAHFKGRIVPHEFRPTVAAAVALIEQHCGPQEWRAERWFAAPAGYGGKIDLVSDEWLLDFKSKPGDAEAHEVYGEHLMQLVAYDMGLDLMEGTRRRRKLANLMVSRDIPGSVAWRPWEGGEQVAWRKFNCLLNYWHLDHDYWPHLEAA